MNNTVLFLTALLIPIPISYLVEALRRAPARPHNPSWSEDITYEYVELGNHRLRYLKVGSGPVIVLLHTLRTQLDMWQRVIPQLANSHTVYALDYPGHGFSDIPHADYTPQYLSNTVEGFLESLSIEKATIIGESIGGTIGLMLAAKNNPRVNSVVAINTYEYDRGRGVYRSTLFARVLFSLSVVPFIGATFWRLRSLPIFRNILLGGVTHNDHFMPELIKEMNSVGNRQGHYQAFMSLIRHFPEWEEGKAFYYNIRVPVLLLFGENDWSTPAERKQIFQLIPNAVMQTMNDCGHFASIDRPEVVVSKVIDFINPIREQA